MYPVIDETHGKIFRRYMLFRTYRVGMYKVRIRILRDLSEVASYAIAEALAEGPRWEEITLIHTNEWYRQLPTFPGSVVGALDPLAAQLVTRAARILGVPPNAD